MIRNGEPGLLLSSTLAPSDSGNEWNTRIEKSATVNVTILLCRADDTEWGGEDGGDRKMGVETELNSESTSFLKETATRST